MRIIISPAKKMIVDTDSMACLGLPMFLEQAEELCSVLRSMDAAALKKLWACNAQIAALNVERLQRMELRAALTPAVLAYDGIQYKHMAPGVFSTDELAYVQEHLRILSGFYGLLRPLDGVTPYRLEMQAKLTVGERKDLYAYWGDRLARQLFAETDCVLNLASKEYSLCVSPYLPPTARFITCVFGEEKNGKVIEKGTLCKMARGEMVRFMAENAISNPEDIQAFDRMGHRFCPELSSESMYVFLR